MTKGSLTHLPYPRIDLHTDQKSYLILYRAVALNVSLIVYVLFLF